MMLPPEVSSNVNSSSAMQDLIDAAVRLIDALPGTFAEREQALLGALQEAGRVGLEYDLQRIEQALPDDIAVGSERRPYRVHQPGTAVYLSLFGELRVQRRTYREVGVRNGPTVVAVELLAGIIEGATPAFAFNVTQGYGMHDMRQHGLVLQSSHRHAPPRATLERLAKRLAERIDEQCPSIEPIVRARNPCPEGTRAISVGLDRASTPMAEPRPAGTGKKPRRSRKKPRVRAVPPPIEVNYRMAYVGTVAFLDEHGETLAVRRYAAPASSCPEDLCARMAADIEAALRRQPGSTVQVVQDGAPEMWNLMREALRPLRRPGMVTKYFEAIDLMHLFEHLSDALIARGEDEVTRARTLVDWKTGLLARDTAIDAIEADLQGNLTGLSDSARKVVSEKLTYLKNNKDRMRYASLVRRGLCLGSGVTESAAKTVINQRTKGAGQRWKDPGLRGVLTVRSILQSDRLPAFWVHFSRLYVANVSCVTNTIRRAA